jgi:prolyl-tRNA synthetase
VDYDRDLEPFFSTYTALYAATDEKHAANIIQNLVPQDLITTRGIEVGHIFYFGTKYSQPMNALVAGPDGAQVPVEMGSYGIGVSRLVGAIIEANHDDAGIIWPESMAPFMVGLINLRVGDAKCAAACDDLYVKLQKAGVEVLYDDRDESAGAKFAAMDLIGLPYQLVVGPRSLAKNLVEVKQRKTGLREEISPDAALARLTLAQPTALP